jgi:predicted  nucleic acid-binding Zn-ribbon protein
LEAENAQLHDEINAIKARVSVAESHAEGLRVEITWREAQALRLEAEIIRLQTEIARLESELAKLRRRGDDDANRDERASEETP